LGLAEVLMRELVMSGLLIADRAFRHETLGWAADYCRAAGKTLRLYGAGWERHPTLAAHAAGPAAAGDELHAITLASRINLQIIGTGVLHPRLLDGLAGGGFFLYRETHNDRPDPAFLAARAAVSRHVAGHGVTRLADLDAVSEPGIAAAWRVIREQYVETQRRQQFDEAVVLRGLATAHALPHATEVMPELAAIAFDSRESFAERAAAFLADESLRASTARALRARVQESFSYDARWAAFERHLRGALTSSGR
jgi:hypothetical protein